MDLGRLLPLIVGGLGVVGFLVGLAPGRTYSLGDGTGDSASVYASFGYLPILVLVVGLLAVAPLLPGGRKYPIPTALLAIAAVLGVLMSLISGGWDVSGLGTSPGIGLILLLIIALVQVVVAGYAALLDAGVRKPPAAKSSAGSPGPDPHAAVGAAQSPPSPTGSGGPPGSPGYGGYPQYGAGDVPPVDPSSSPYGSPYGSAPSGDPTPGSPGTSRPRTDDGPSDVTQQVRF